MSCCIVDMDPVKQNKIIAPKIRLSKKARLDFTQPNFQSMSGYVMHNIFVYIILGAIIIFCFIELLLTIQHEIFLSSLVFLYFLLIRK